MARIAIAASMLCALLASGCRTTNVAGDYSIDQGKDAGVAVVSLTMSGLPSSFNMFINYRAIGSDQRSAVPVTDLFASADWPCPLLGIATSAAPCGRLAVIELQPGDYEFYTWSGSSGSGTGMTTTVRSAKEFSKRFTVTRGKAVYLGNIHFAVDGGRATIGSSTGSYAMRMSDRRDRDIPLLQKKHPKLTQDQLLVKILEN